MQRADPLSSARSGTARTEQKVLDEIMSRRNKSSLRQITITEN